MEGTISTTSGKETKIDFRIRALDSGERKRLALKALGTFWGLALVTAPLPPIHWVTVPGFFLFGIYWALKKLREPEHFEKIVFRCPECGGEVHVAPQVVQNPLSFVCPQCRYGLKLQFERA